MTDWSSLKAPTPAEFEHLAAVAWANLPSEFRTLCTNVEIRIEEYGADDVLDELEIEDPLELLGLYQGISLAQKAAGDLPRGPDFVFLYRRAILDYWSDGDETLGHLVTHVLIHEIGHHFGLSDEDMERIERDASGPEGSPGG
jgi:predicted Zn-dependent protease with MMP-like domain